MSFDPNFVYQRNYRGEVQGVVLDWSGTVSDPYVIAPAIVFVEVFKNQGIEISMLEARGPMGLRKDLHIKALTEDYVISERWRTVHGKYPNQKDVDRMFADFVPMQLKVLSKYTKLIPGALKCYKELRKRGLKIGSSTAFTRPMVDILNKAAKKQGFIMDATVAGDEVANGARP